MDPAGSRVGPWRERPIVVICPGEDPRGFPAKMELPSGLGRSPQEVATPIAVWFTRDPILGPGLIQSTMAEVHNARSYKDGEVAVLRVEAMRKLAEPGGGRTRAGVPRRQAALPLSRRSSGRGTDLQDSWPADADQGRIANTPVLLASRVGT